MSNIIAKCGFNRHTKRKRLYTDRLIYGVANFRSLYSLCVHLLSTGEARVMQDNYYDTQLHGHNTHWASPHHSLSTFTIHSHIWKSNGWCPSANTYLPSREISNWTKTTCQHAQKDSMTVAILRSEQFTAQEIRLLNYCRLYLQVVTLSDITYANGYSLDLAMLHGKINNNSSQTKWHHFNQKRPPAQASMGPVAVG